MIYNKSITFSFTANFDFLERIGALKIFLEAFDLFYYLRRLTLYK